MPGNPHAKALHESEFSGVFLVTGGGVTLLAELLSEPGASATVLEANVPYAEAALTEQLGGKPDQACSVETARALAMAAFQRAGDLSATDTNSHRQSLIGFGCTAALATNRKKRGAHRAYLAVQTFNKTATATVEFNKGTDGFGDRAREEDQVTALAWRLLEETLGIRLDAPDLADSSKVHLEQTSAPTSWSQLLAGQIASCANQPEHSADAIRPKALLPGSFNPLHAGHLQMAEHASRVLNTEVAFELCIDNVDKPALSYFDLHRRSSQFERLGQNKLWLTNLPTFIEKAREFPNCNFVVGIDTLVRIGMPRYYESIAAMHDSFAEYKKLGTQFLVFGRSNAKGFQTLVTSEVPAALAALCTNVAESEFRVDLSSTELRTELRKETTAE